MSPKLFNAREKKWVYALRRRIRRLEQRLMEYEGHDQSPTRAELSALRWVLRILQSAPELTLSEILKRIRL